MATQPNSESRSSARLRPRKVNLPSTGSPARTLTQGGSYEAFLTVVPLVIGVVTVFCLSATVMAQPVQSLLNSSVVVLLTNFGINY